MAYTEEEKYKHQAYQFLVDQMNRSRGQEMSGLAGLINASGINPEAGQAALTRYGINTPVGQSRQQAALQQQMQLAAFRAALSGKKGGGALPPDLIGAIGTPDFGAQLRSSVGSLDRQSVEMLMNLDRQERQFQAKGVAKPGKASPYLLKLREMEALGIPITEETVRGAYGNKENVIDKGSTTGGHWWGGGTKVPPRQISLSALAGLGGGATQDLPTDVAAPDDRMRRLGSTLFGD